MVVLYAFMETSNICGWFPIWKGDYLTDLSKSEWNYFKDYYGLDSLSLQHEYCHKDTYDDYYLDDEFTEDF